MAKIRNEKTYKWAGKIWWEKASTRTHLAQNFKNIISSNFSLKLL